MTSSPTKCDILRAGAAATASKAAGCDGATPQTDCSVMALLAKKDMYIQTKYDPSGLVSKTDRLVRTKVLSNLQGDINTLTDQIQSRFGKEVPASDLSWGSLTECLLNPDGSPGGGFGNKYYRRNDLESLGYQPRPALGAATLQGKIPAKLTQAIPVWMDHVVNPDLAVILVFAILIIIFGVLMYNAYNWQKGAPAREAAAKTARQAKMEESDPYKGTAFESYPSDPDTKWKSLIPIYEAQGYCMEAYRKKLGMPVTDSCAG
jgi:hypothetical protein